jgi:hypothetical protein
MTGVESNDDGVAGAYWQSYSYDVWSNMASRTGGFWSQNDNDYESYDTRGRNIGWEYDADGRLISRNEPAPDTLPYVPLRQSYDAAGRLTLTTQTTSTQDPTTQQIYTGQNTRTELYDGDGTGIMEATDTGTTYYLRSSVLGGQVIAEYDGQGNRQNEYLYAGGVKVIRQASGQVSGLFWQHQNPVTGDLMETDGQGVVAAKETLDPTGVSVEDSDPFTPPAGGGGDEGLTQGQMDGRFAQLLPSSMGGAGQCSIDGIQVGCGLVNTVLSTGAGVQCPDNDCGPHGYSWTINGMTIRGVTQPFQAFADGYSGYLPAGIQYVGDGLILNSDWTGDGTEKLSFDDLTDNPWAGLVGQFMSNNDNNNRHMRRRKAPLPQPQGGAVGVAITNFSLGPHTNFDDDQKSKLQRAFNRPNTTGCKGLFRQVLAEFGQAPTDTHGIKSLDDAMGVVQLNLYSSSLSAADMGLSQADRDGVASNFNLWLPEGANAFTSKDSQWNQVYLAPQAFKDSSYFAFTERDLVGIIFHELLHVAGYRDKVVGPLYWEGRIKGLKGRIQAECSRTYGDL